MDHGCSGGSWLSSTHRYLFVHVRLHFTTSLTGCPPLAAHAKRAAALEAIIDEVLEDRRDLEAEVKRLRAERSDARSDAMMGCMW